MRKYIALIAILALMTIGLDAQSGRRSGMTSGIQSYIETTDFDSIHVGAGKFIYGATGSGQAVTATGDELNYLDITTLGIGAVSKALVLSAAGSYHWPSADTLYYEVIHDGTNAVTSDAGELNILDGVTATTSEMNYLDIVTPGIGVVSKAVVVSAAGSYHWPSGDTLYYEVIHDGTNAVTSDAAELNILDGVTATFDELNYLNIATLGIGAVSKALVLSSAGSYHWPSADTLYYSVLHDGTDALTSTASQLNAIPATTSSAAQLNYLDIALLGTGVNTKAVVLDGGGDYTWEAGGVLTYAILNDGSNAITASALEINYTDITALGTQEASKVVTTNSDSNSGVSKVTQLWIGTTGGETRVDATAAELNYNDITTLGTQEASKVVTTDAQVNSGISKVTQLWIGSSGAETRVLSSAAELDMRALTVKMIDVSSAGQVHVVSPYAGNVTAVYSVLNATIATAPAGITIKDKDGNTMGTITIADGGSGPGDVDSNTSLSNADVAVGDMIEIETDNASTNTVEVEFTILIAIQ